VTWKVESKELAAKETLKESTTLAKAVVISGSGIEVSCTKLAVKKGYIEGAAGGAAEALVLTACTVPAESTACEVEKSEIKTKEVNAKLEAGVKVAFIPKTGEEFTTFKIVNKGSNECEKVNSYKVTGSLVANVNKAGTELKEQLFAFTSTSGSSLKLAGKVATLTGEADLSLSSGKTWGAS